MRTPEQIAALDQLKDLVAQLEAMWPDTLDRPCGPEFEVTQPFGYDPTYPYNSGWHKGKDYACPVGTPCWFRESGTVVRAGFNQPTEGPAYNDGAGNGAWGGYVEIISDRNPEVYWGLAHLSEIHVQVGQHINQGQLAGFTGATGTGTGPHLHEQKWLGQGRVDPDGQD